MTSRLTSYDFHVRVKARSSGLDRDSTVMLEQISTISQTRLRKRLGRLPNDIMLEVDGALRHSLGMLD
jgi:mRNA interferase MazF